MSSNSAQCDDGRDIVLTVATHEEGYFSYFMQSCLKYNITPVVIGHGVQWNGFGTKFNLIKNWIAQNANDNDRILIVDCYDLIFLRNLDPLFRAFEAKAKACSAGQYNYMYAASEPLSWPISLVAGSFYGLYKGKLINSGSFLAYGALLKKIFTDPAMETALRDNKIADDQALLIEYLQHHNEVNCHLDDNFRFIVYFALRLDIGARLDVSDPENVLYRQNNATTSRPYLLHRNGNGSMVKILQQLGYNITQDPDNTSFIRRIFHCHVPAVVDKLVMSPMKSTVQHIAGMLPN